MTRVGDRNPELPVDPDAQDDALVGRERPVHLRPALIGFVLIGGFVGALARYGVSLLFPLSSSHWPIGTFTVNLVGAFILGALLEGLARGGPDAGWRQRARLLLGTGFCGALTTYSTLAVESDLLVRSNRLGLAGLYILASLAGGLVATALGISVAASSHRWVRQRQETR